MHNAHSAYKNHFSLWKTHHDWFGRLAETEKFPSCLDQGWKMRDPELDDTSLSERIRDLRKSLGFSQARFAAELGVHQSNVSRWENGACPDDRQLQRLAELAGMSVGAFRYGERKPIEATQEQLTVPLVGRILRGQEVQIGDEATHRRVAFRVASGQAIKARSPAALEICEDAMHPIRSGWLVFFDRSRLGVQPDCLNQLCVVQLQGSAAVLVRELRRGYRPKTYNLMGWSTDMIEDVTLDWAAPILAIQPPG
jgi:transcriptional regulator with XRE-family HTH domain